MEVAGAAVLVAAALAWSATIAVRMPVWSPLDEGAHYTVAHHLATTGALPAPGSGPDIPGGLPRWPPPDISLEAYQPPLDYALLAGVEKLTVAVWPHVADGSGINTDLAVVRADRLTNAVFFAGIVLLLWLGARLLAPGNLVMAWAMPASAFVWRGVVLDATRVGNDILPGLLATLAVYLALRWRSSPSLWRMAVIGAVLGLGVLSKYTAAYAVIPVVLIVLAAAPSRDRLCRAVIGIATAGAAALAVVLPWVLTQRAVRGCFLCATEQRADVPAALAMPRPSPRVVYDLSLTNLHSLFDGQNGGGQIRPTHGVLDEALPWVVAVLVLAGLVAALAGRIPGDALTARLRAALVVSVLAFPVFITLASVSAGTAFLATARYDLPAILPVAWLFAAGCATVAGRLDRRAVAAVVLVGALALGVNEIRLGAGPWPPGIGTSESTAAAVHSPAPPHGPT